MLPFLAQTDIPTLSNHAQLTFWGFVILGTQAGLLILGIVALRRKPSLDTDLRLLNQDLRALETRQSNFEKRCIAERAELMEWLEKIDAGQRSQLNTMEFPISNVAEANLRGPAPPHRRPGLARAMLMGIQ